jgi:hypothetical protein
LEPRCLITREIFSGEVEIDVYKITTRRSTGRRTRFDEQVVNGTIETKSW